MYRIKSEANAKHNKAGCTLGVSRRSSSTRLLKIFFKKIIFIIVEAEYVEAQVH